MADLIPSLKPTFEELKRACYNDFVFFTGPPALGKTTLVKRLFEERKADYLHAFINCYTVRNSAELLSQICQAFHSALNVRRSKSSKSSQNLPEPGQPVTLNDFEPALQEYKSIASGKGFKRIFVVMDQIEAFERTPMMDTFSTLCRYNTEDIRLVVISCEGPMDMIHYITNKSAAIAASVQDRCVVVLCNEWSVEDITNWILETSPKKDPGIYEKFVKNAVSLLFASRTRNPAEIKMFCLDAFQEFVVFYKERRREIVMKQVDLNSSEITDGELDEFEREGYFNSAVLVSNFLKTFRTTLKNFKTDANWTSDDAATHLPGNSGVLIVAAYVAAYTKPSDDRLNFVKCQRKKSSSRRKIVEPEMINRPFTLERLVQIYFAIMKSCRGEKVLNFIYNNDCVLADIERLKNLGILQHISGSIFSSESRYKLSQNIKKKYVIRLAKNNSFESLHELQGLTGMAEDD